MKINGRSKELPSFDYFNSLIFYKTDPGTGNSQWTIRMQYDLMGKVVESEDAEQGLRRFFHGTDVDTAVDFLNGKPLDIIKSKASKIDGQDGFFLATSADDAEFFATRRYPALC